MRDATSYNIPAIVMHWLVALLIAATFPIAWIMVDMQDDSPEQLSLFSLHITIGVSVLMLAIARLVNRALRGVPAAPADTPAIVNKLTSLVHFALYALLFIVPMSGWVMSSAGGHDVSWLGLFTLPSIVVADDSLHHTMEGVHETVANVLLGLIALHTAAALKHHFIQRDGVLARMLPFLRK
ncbi:MAG: cytochrome b [Sulfuriferula sp.]|nr:cytochrome b [Sulfuriferula sp.]